MDRGEREQAYDAHMASRVNLTPADIDRRWHNAVAGSIREPGVGDFAPPPVQKKKRLRIREVGGTERVYVLDPTLTSAQGGSFLQLDHPEPRPWVLEQESARWSVFAIEELTLEEINDGEEAA